MWNSGDHLICRNRFRPAKGLPISKSDTLHKTEPFCPHSTSVIKTVPVFMPASPREKRWRPSGAREGHCPSPTVPAAQPPSAPSLRGLDFTLRQQGKRLGECPLVRSDTPSVICSYLANASSPKGDAKAPSGRATAAQPPMYASVGLMSDSADHAGPVPASSQRYMVSI